MIKSVNLKYEANSIGELFQYKRVGTLNSHTVTILRKTRNTVL